MREDLFTQAISEIYGTYGKSVPVAHIRQAIFKHISALPDSFMAYAQRKLEDMETLPVNLGRFMFQNLWPEFLAENPNMKVKVAACSDCDPLTPGYFLAWRPDGIKIAFKCACQHEYGWTHERALEAGYLFTDPLATGNYHPSWLNKILGNAYAPRKEHLAYMDELESDYAPR